MKLLYLFPQQFRCRIFIGISQHFVVRARFKQQLVFFGRSQFEGVGQWKWIALDNRFYRLLGIFVECVGNIFFLRLQKQRLLTVMNRDQYWIQTTEAYLYCAFKSIKMASGENNGHVVLIYSAHRTYRRITQKCSYEP